MRTDFRPNYSGANPVSHFFHACPNCGFCGKLNTYKLSIDEVEFKKEIKKMTSLKNDTSSVPLNAKIMRAVRCLEKMKDYNIKHLDELTLANKWVMAFWWSETTKERKKNGKITLDYLEQAFEKDQVPDKWVLRYIYLQGEIHRRIGNLEKANSFFDKTIELATEYPDPKDLASVAKQQKEDPEETF
jgi:tetratricopeptide (TPR) repeat protein